MLTSDGVVLRGQFLAGEPYDVDWKFSARTLPDGEWTRDTNYQHQRMDASG